MTEILLPSLDIRREDIMSPLASSLITALNQELSALYPEEGATHFRLDPEEVAPDRGAFITAHLDGHAVGCGAVRRIDAHTAELKRMYVKREARGRGVGRHLLSALEDEARRLGVTRLVLETGVRQTSAIALYTRAGFQPIPAYGEYIGSPLSLCLAKPITSPPA